MFLGWMNGYFHTENFCFPSNSLFQDPNSGGMLAERAFGQFSLHDHSNFHQSEHFLEKDDILDGG